ncbi:MAG: PLDc_N domain-containing protein [Roseivirga sp.]|nr:PLDc_N domain-containing protein [Roseivirga sp.]
MEATLFGILIVSSLVLWFWAITDITRSRFNSASQRTGWLLIVLFFPTIGSILYFQLRKRFTTQKRRVFKPAFNRHLVR